MEERDFRTIMLLTAANNEWNDTFLLRSWLACFILGWNLLRDYGMIVGMAESLDVLQVAFN
jgi:hypothetical protein